MQTYLKRLRNRVLSFLGELETNVLFIKDRRPHCGMLLGHTPLESRDT